VLVEVDLHQHYGIDIDDRELLRRKSWRWLSLRILGLLSIESRLRASIYPEEEK
jgi:hypothetical protein